MFSLLGDSTAKRSSIRHGGFAPIKISFKTILINITRSISRSMSLISTCRLFRQIANSTKHIFGVSFGTVVLIFKFAKTVDVGLV